MNWFRWCLCAALVLQLHFVSSPLPASAADVQPDARAVSPAPATAVSDPAVPALPMPDEAAEPDSAGVPQKVESSRQAIGFLVPAGQGLAELVGVTEVSVSVDVEGQFVRHLADSLLPDDRGVAQLPETDLADSLRAGRGFNRESLAALQRVEQASAQTDQARALLLPSVTVRASRGYERSEPSVLIDEATGELKSADTHLRSDASLTVRQPLFNLPVFFDWRRRQMREQARGETYRVSDGDAYLATVTAYLSLVASRLQTDITRDFEAQLQELLNYIEKRAGAGAASIADMSRVQARSQATRSSRLEQESVHAAAGIEFLRLTNLVPQMLLLPVPEDVGAALLPESFDEAVAAAMRTNPEIAALTAEVEAARVNRAAARGEFLPRVDAEYTDTYSRHAGGSKDSQRDKRLMLVLNWDLFSGGGDYQAHVERNAQLRELQYRLDDQRRRVVKALMDNYSALATTRERLASGYLELKSIATAAEAMSKRMLSGNQSLLDLLDVYDRYFQVRSRLVDLHIFEMNTVAQLIRLTLGTPWTDVPQDPEPVEAKLTPLPVAPPSERAGWGEGA